MGGLFTIVKVRDHLESYDKDPGWYKHPPGTVALKATDEELRRDGIVLSALEAGGSGRSNSAAKQTGHGEH
jgi:hypothetical protein